jgi:hypothetical protein
MPTLREFRTLDLLAEEAARRPIRRRLIEVVDYTPADPAPETHIALEGTVTILAARPGSQLMSEIREALAKRPANTAAVAGKLYRQYKNRKAVPLSRAVKTGASQPVIADVMHGELTLIESLFVPADMEVIFVPLAYNGGRLVQEGLVIVEHPVSEDAEQLEILAVRHAPRLTPAERAAVDKVPPQQLALNLGFGPGPVECSVALATALLVAEVVIVAVTFAITGKVHLEHMEHLSDSKIAKMGANAAARSLVELRREFLRKKPIRVEKQRK